MLAREEVYAAFLGAPAQARTFFHGHSYTANPLCCAAAIANLDLMAERGTVEHAARVGDRIGELTKGLETYDGVREVRRVGTMTGIEVASVGERTGFEVCQEARRRGVWVRPLGDVVVLMPPLAIGDDDLETLCGRRRREHPRGGAMTDPLEPLRQAAAARAAAGAAPRAAAPRLPTTTLLDLASNDYLGLARDPRVTGAAAEAALRWGAGSTGSRLVTGSTDLHAGLEADLADFVGARGRRWCSPPATWRTSAR